MSSTDTFVTCRNWQGREIWDFDGKGLGFIVFVFRLRPGAERAIFSGLLIKRSTFCQNSVAALLESKLNPIILLWSVDADDVRWNSWKVSAMLLTYPSTDTSCGRRVAKLYSWTNCRLYLSTKQSMFRVPLTQRLHAVNFDFWLILCRTSALEHPCTAIANPSSLCLRINLQALSWCKSKQTVR